MDFLRPIFMLMRMIWLRQKINDRGDKRRTAVVKSLNSKRSINGEVGFQ